MNHSLVMLRESWASSNPGESGGYWIARFRACEIIRPHPEERRFLAARLEGWPLAQQCLLPSFETAAQEGGLLRMRAFNFFTRSFAGDDMEVMQLLLRFVLKVFGAKVRHCAISGDKESWPGR